MICSNKEYRGLFGEKKSVYLRFQKESECEQRCVYSSGQGSGSTILGYCINIIFMKDKVVLWSPEEE